MPAAQRTLVLLKPDCVQRALLGEVIGRASTCKGLRLAGLKLMSVPSELAAVEHYRRASRAAVLRLLLQFITSTPLVAMVLEGDEAISVVRSLIGSTDGRKAAPGTIRGDFSLSKSNNLVHASDSPESALRELAIWFPEGVQAAARCDTTWVEPE